MWTGWGRARGGRSGGHPLPCEPQALLSEPCPRQGMAPGEEEVVFSQASSASPFLLPNASPRPPGLILRTSQTLGGLKSQLI